MFSWEHCEIFSNVFWKTESQLTLPSKLSSVVAGQSLKPSGLPASVVYHKTQIAIDWGIFHGLPNNLNSFIILINLPRFLISRYTIELSTIRFSTIHVFFVFVCVCVFFFLLLITYHEQTDSRGDNIHCIKKFKNFTGKLESGLIPFPFRKK